LKNHLPFDFYLKKYNAVIEYNGLQHYEFFEYFHKTEDEFEKRKEVSEAQYKEIIDSVTNKYGKLKTVGQAEADKLNEELALAKQNVSDEQIAQAEALMNRNETQVILDRMNARLVELEEKRRLLKVEYEEKKVMFENEKQAYQSMVDQKKQIDDNYFAIFGSKIEKQKKSIEETIKMMQNLAGT
jgi:hypothetical protein